MKAGIALDPIHSTTRPTSSKASHKAFLSIVCMAKFSYQSKKLLVIEKDFSRRRFNLKYVFLAIF